jgi:hypothetical protein
MKIHMRNIVEGAISRGLIDGYLHVKSSLATSMTEEQEMHQLHHIADHIWQELDSVIDFADDGDDDDDRRSIGFAPADAVASTVIDDDGMDDVESDHARKRRFLRTSRLRLRR